MAVKLFECKKCASKKSEYYTALNLSYCPNCRFREDITLSFEDDTDEPPDMGVVAWVPVG